MNTAKRMRKKGVNILTNALVTSTIKSLKDEDDQMVSDLSLEEYPAHGFET